MGFTEAYAQVRTELETLFSSYNEVDNPYSDAELGNLNVRASFGISIGSGVNVTRSTCSRADIEREFNIILYRRINAIRNDTATRITAEKKLFEDQTLIIKRFEVKIPNVTRARYISDSGVEFLNGDRYNYMKLSSNFLVEYSENL